MKHAVVKGNLEHCSRKLFAYGGREIEVVGQFKAEISVGLAKVVSSFVLVKCGRCILGNVTTKELGVVHIDPRPVPSVAVVIKSRVTLPTISKLNTLKCSPELAN